MRIQLLPLHFLNELSPGHWNNEGAETAHRARACSYLIIIAPRLVNSIRALVQKM
jgi:hypothetical protein